MVSITFVAPDGATHLVRATPGASLMSAAVAARVPGVEAACGGSMVCGTCHVFVAEPWFSALPPAQSGEMGLLECSLHQSERSRLSCQLSVSPALEGAVITVPPTQT